MRSQVPNGLSATIPELLAYQNSCLAKFPPKGVKSNQSGQYISNIRGRGMDFSEVRAYQTGDDVRQMEWRVTARTNEPHIKLYHEEKERPIFILVDYNASMFFGTRVAYKSVIASRFAAMLAFAASHNGDKVGGILFSGSEIKDLRPKSKKYGVLPLIQQLSQFSSTPPNQDEKSLSTILLQLRKVVKPGSLVFILSDFEHLGEQAPALLRRLSLHADIVNCFISDPLERLAPPPGRYELTDGTDEFILDTFSKNVQKNYSAAYKTKQHYIQKITSPSRLLEISTDDDLSQHLFHAFSTQRGWQ